MYQEFKQKLLNEMEMRRDMIVLQYAEPSVEPIFEVSSADDKLYKRILEEFDRLAVGYADNLLQALSVKYGILEKNADRDPGALIMTVDGKKSYIELKTNVARNQRVTNVWVKQVQHSDLPVCFVFLLKDSQESRKAIMRQETEMRKLDSSLRIRALLLDDIFAEQFGAEEWKRFREAMATFKEEMHQTVGYQITEIFNPHNLEQLKTNLKGELFSMDYDRIMHDKHIELQAEGESIGDLFPRHFTNIKKLFLEQGRYELLLGKSDFAKSFLTSEWIYNKYFFLPEMDNTFVVAGYLKSIEQLLWSMIQIVGHGRQIKGQRETRVAIKEENADMIDKTLGSLEYFLTDRSNTDLFERCFGTHTRFVQRFLKGQLKLWRKKYRNGYFHKHNLTEEDTIKDIRTTTIYLHMLILGTISLDEETVVLLDA